MVMGTIEIENKADVISISSMVYSAKKGSRFFQAWLVLYWWQNWASPAERGRGGYELIQGLLFCCSGFTSPFLTRSHEGEWRAVGACGGVHGRDKCCRVSPLQKANLLSVARGRGSWLVLRSASPESLAGLSVV